MVWSNRFFFLPWALKPSLAAVVGSTSRISQHPLGGPGSPKYASTWWFPPVGDPYPTTPFGPAGGGAPDYGILRAWYDYQNVGTMATYAVTIDPTRVPLTTTKIYSDVSTNGGGTYPAQPRYTMNSGGGIYKASVYLTSSAAKPDTLIDATGPFFDGSIGMRPAFFSVYETTGLTSLNGSGFIFPGSGSTLSPKAMYVRRYREVGGTFQSGANFYSDFETGGICPWLAYVLRPSTGAIVGWLYSQSWKGPAGGTGSVPSVDIGTGQIPATPYKNSVDQPSNYDTTWNVTGMQDGDLIVWEWWHYFRKQPGGVAAAYPARAWRDHVSVEFGGGLSGQPLTYNGGGAPTTNGVPDYASAQGCNLAAMSGIEPVEFTPTYLIRASPGTTGIELEFIDGTPERTMTTVEPYGTGLRLVFGDEVILATPVDVGTPYNGIGVLGVTDTSTTVKQVALATRPDHPTGQADTHTLAPPIGEADNLGPPIPTGIGAVVI
jgi:hypothetical protein